MAMKPGLRRFVLLVHITVSVSWIGAVLGFLVLSIAGLKSHNQEVIRGAFVSMDLVGQYAIVPLSFATLVTGLVQALGTQWGLFRYYWVFVKLLLTIFATAALLVHQFTAVKNAAAIALGGAFTLPNEQLSKLGFQLVADSTLAILVLLTATVLSVYKPWGLTNYGRLKLQSQGNQSLSKNVPVKLSFKIFLIVIVLAVAAFVISHLMGGGLGRHGLQ